MHLLLGNAPMTRQCPYYYAMHVLLALPPLLCDAWAQAPWYLTLFPLQRQDSNLGCVFGEFGKPPWGWSSCEPPAARRPPARPPGTVCVPHRDTVLSLYSRYTMCIQQIYNVYTADIWIVNTAECQIWRKIMKNELNQVQMAPFGLIINQDGSYGVWEASGIPPGPQNRQKRQKT